MKENEAVISGTGDKKLDGKWKIVGIRIVNGQPSLQLKRIKSKRKKKKA